jgi:hypothetical protein
MSTPVSAVTAASASVPVKDGGAVSWEELFPESQAATTPEGQQTQQVQAQPVQTAVTVPATPVIQTKTGTVYKTVEDAIRGIEHKDTVIADMRTRMILATGIDPLTGQPALPSGGVQQPANYMQDRKRFVDDLKTAAAKDDTDGIWNAQTKLIFDALQPLTPVMANLAKQQAVEQLAPEIKDIREFIGSDNYKQALTETPDLKAAIEAAENDYQHFNRLPGLYKVAYRVSQGIRLPEILKAQPQAPASQPVRPTTASQTLTPTTPEVAAHPSLMTRDGRKALRAQLEAKGVADMPLV